MYRPFPVLAHSDTAAFRYVRFLVPAVSSTCAFSYMQFLILVVSLLAVSLLSFSITGYFNYMPFPITCRFHYLLFNLLLFSITCRFQYLRFPVHAISITCTFLYLQFHNLPNQYLQFQYHPFPLPAVFFSRHFLTCCFLYRSFPLHAHSASPTGHEPIPQECCKLK